MPPKRRLAQDLDFSDPPVLGNSSNLSKEQIEHCLELLFQEIDKSVETRCSILMSAAEESVQTLRSEYGIQMMLLSKKVRNMPLREFQEQYGGSISSLISEDINRRMITHLGPGMYTPAISREVSISEGIARTVLRTRPKKTTSSISGPSMALQDAPAALLNAPDAAAKPPGTASRPIRRGEVLYSKNGSPLAQAALPSGSSDGEMEGDRDEADENRALGPEASGPAALALPMVTPMAGGKRRGLTRGPGAGAGVDLPLQGFLLTTAGPGKRRRARTTAEEAAEGAGSLEVRRPDGRRVSMARAPEDVREALRKVTTFLAQQAAL